jgi:hypothetical protein
MQQFGTSPEAVAHGRTVGDGNRGEFDESGSFYFVGQATDAVPDDFLNGDFPCVAQQFGDGFNGIAPLVLIALIKVVAFVSKLVGQAGHEVADAARLEGRFTAAETGLVCAATDGTDGNLWLRLGIVRCPITGYREDGRSPFHCGRSMRRAHHRQLAPNFRTNTSGGRHGGFVPIAVILAFPLCAVLQDIAQDRPAGRNG